MYPSSRRRSPAPQAAGSFAYEWDVPGGTMRWLPGVRHVFGHPVGPRAWRVERWTGLLHPHDLGFVDGVLVEALQEDDEAWRAEYRVRRADGTYADARDEARIVRDAEGRAMRLVGALTDLTGPTRERVRQARPRERAAR